jgi:NADPH-dependent glutamate synthase beta subunit-like oxidoreductase/CO/xanthine dehydrogenase FAD-binding subunit
MILQPFKYVAADSLETVEALLREYGERAALIAGGSDRLGTLKDAIHGAAAAQRHADRPSAAERSADGRDGYPELVVSLKPLQSLRYVRVDPDDAQTGVQIGALTTLAEIAGHPVLNARYPLLVQAARSVASPQIRNVATIAGNLCQEPRCWYYRYPENGFHCLRKGGKQCNALFGENRYHSIFGGMCVDGPACVSTCPDQTDIPAYMSLIRAGRPGEAAEILLRTNPMPAITGRVCPHTCESECNRSVCDEPVSVREVERFLGDYVLERAGEFYRAPERSLEQGGAAHGAPHGAPHIAPHIAVVGAGPAGLTAAYFLRRSGCQVTVFDRMPEAGGMLAYSIPAYRLPKGVVRAYVQALAGMGIRFELGVDIGSPGYSLAELRARYASVFLATGLWQQKALRMEDDALLDWGLGFLIDIQRGQAKPIGRRVLVIGGGSVAVDVAMSARRLGAEEVWMACLESRETMPAIEEDVEGALQEGVNLLPSWGPGRILVQDGKLQGMELVRCAAVFDERGRFAPTFDPGVTRVIEVDQVLVAIGQSADLAYLETTGPSPATERGLIVSTGATLGTDLPGVFAGGDVTSGPATVVEAIAAGRKAAASIEEYLRATGRDVEPGNWGQPGSAAPADIGRKRPIALVVNQAALASSARVSSPELSPAARTLSGEDRATLAAETARQEAQRCANCGCVAVNASDLAPALVALDARIKTTQRSLAAEELFGVVRNRTTVLQADELITEIEIPAPPPGSVQRYLKFRLRNAIDFPILSVAFCSTLERGRFHDTRIVLGAVAPVPLRARSVEVLLEGQEPGEDLARAAGTLAAAAAQPLAGNKFKVEVLKSLVRRAVGMHVAGERPGAAPL